MTTDPGPIRFSHLKAYGRSGMHGWQARFGEERKQSQDMELGEAVHAIVFGTRPVCGYPGSQRRGKEYDAFEAAHFEHIILTKNDYAKAVAMADAVRECKLAEPYLAGTVEKLVLFRWMGEDCRCTPDVRGADFTTELKTTSNADPDWFTWHAIRRMHYPAQLRMQGLGCSVSRHYIVAVESEAPYPVTVFDVGPRALLEGEKQLVLWMERLKSCESSKQWPPYVSSVMPLEVPDETVVEFDE